MKSFSSPKKCILSLALVTLLSACGGSGSNDTPLPEPVELTFSLNSVLVNNCGVESPFSDIELLLQDSDWQTIESYQADKNGLITFKTFDENINYTLVAKNQVGEGVEGLNIESYYQAKTAIESRYIARYDQQIDPSSCQCIIHDIELTHRTLKSRITVTSSLDFESFEVLTGGKTLYKNVEVCRETGGTWPLSSFAVIGTNLTDEKIGVATFSDDFVENSEGIWQLNAFDVAQEVILNSQHQNFNSAQLIQGNTYFSITVDEDDTSLLLFNSHDYTSETLYRSEARLELARSSSFFGTMLIESSHHKISSMADESFSVIASTIKPDIDDVNFSEIKADGSYDYSAVKGYPMAVISFELTTINPETNQLMPTKWINYGPAKGLLAISAPLTGYEDIVDINTTRTVTDTKLLNSINSDTYLYYINHYQANTTDDFANDLKQYHIKITK